VSVLNKDLLRSAQYTLITWVIQNQYSCCYKAKVVVWFDSHARHTDTMWAQCSIFEC